ncbi:MAG: OB-fold nucleic acid binding domain-containing protein, partial [Blastocatellia bacterium]
IKDAQHHGLKFKPIDVTQSDWLCAIEEERSQRKLRMGLMYVKGLRRSSGDAILAERSLRPFTSIEDLRLRVPELNKAEMRKLAQVGALNFIGRVGIGSYHRRSALWNVERAARPAGPLLHGAGVLEMEVDDAPIKQFGSLEGEFFSKACMKDRSDPDWIGSDSDSDDKEIDHLDDPKDREDKPSIGDESPMPSEAPTRDEGPTENTSSISGDSPLKPMTSVERLNADLSGTGFTIGPHPMAYIREQMVEMAVTTVSDLRRLPNNATARVAGAVIVRQRPGTAKGFLFLSLEDETGILNIIVNPDTFDDNKIPLVESNFLVIDGVVQSQGGVVSVKANKVRALDIA